MAQQLFKPFLKKSIPINTMGFAMLLALILFGSCTLEQKRQTGSLPPARGGKGEVVVVMDSAKWSTELGEAVRGVFAEPISALPQPEPIFSLTSVTSSQFKSILQQCRNIAIITTFDSDAAESRILQNYFTEDSRKQMEENPERFMFKKQDVYANGQLILYLFAQNEEQLIRQLKENKEKLQEIFNERENEEMREKVLASEALNHDLIKAVRNSHGIGLKIPQGYKVAKDTAYKTDKGERGFLWLRDDEGKFDQHILISHRPYTSEEAFEDQSLIDWRNTLGKRYIYGDRENKPDSYMITEDQVPVYFKAEQLDGQYAKEMRGLWKLNKVFWGGPFLSYAAVSPSTGRLYYLEGLLAAPGSNKREKMRELELVLQSATFAEKQ